MTCADDCTDVHASCASIVQWLSTASAHVDMYAPQTTGWQAKSQVTVLYDALHPLLGKKDLFTNLLSASPLKTTKDVVFSVILKSGWHYHHREPCAGTSALRQAQRIGNSESGMARHNVTAPTIFKGHTVRPLTAKQVDSQSSTPRYRASTWSTATQALDCCAVRPPVVKPARWPCCWISWP